MISISHMPSPRSLSNSFSSLVQPFNSSFRSAQQFLWHFSSSFSTFGDRRSVSLKYWPVFLKIRGSSFMPSSLLFRLWGILLYHPKHFMNSFHCDPPKAIISEYFFVLSFQLCPPNILHWCLFVRLHIFTVVLSRLPSVVIVLIHLFFS